MRNGSNARIPLREHGVRFAHFVRSSGLIYGTEIICVFSVFRGYWSSTIIWLTFPL